MASLRQVFGAAAASVFPVSFAVMAATDDSQAIRSQPVKHPKRVAIVGATGAVGEELLNVLRQRQFPMSEIRLYASARSAGKVVPSPLGMLEIEEFSVDKARNSDVVFFATNTAHAQANVPLIAQRSKVSGLFGWFGFTSEGPLVVDNSKAFRYSPDVPLVVPEVNGEEALKAVKRGQRIIANPNCTTAIAALVLWPLHQRYGLEQVVMSTYQAASGAGGAGMDELTSGTAWQLKTGHIPPHHVFPHPLPFNVIPQIDVFCENGYTKEEMKVVWETRKIFGLAKPEDLALSCTAVRIPTLRAHAEAITLRTREPCKAAEARDLLRSKEAPGVTVLDDPAKLEYPMPLNSSGQESVFVGRIRQSLVHGDRGLDMFVCGDQLLRGAALNAVLIAEHVYQGK
eukprot:CAMPEP_0172589320 /NCGR_PEP_ID=MMETSP1068-20121228/8098_1 /TAXON_ID=35684 /ORGANISM="Pseudopedinella elastica, Strain CCMP716" /LENGTH=398 /DNA_ID=CAMNT_0013384907 /DNA_START=109 /DNA_END=1305 /DNA_ORIENTATION=+